MTSYACMECGTRWSEKLVRCRLCGSGDIELTGIAPLQGAGRSKVLVVLEVDSPASLRRALRDEAVAALSPAPVVHAAPAHVELAQAEKLLRGLFLRASYNAGTRNRNPYVAPRRRPPKTLGVKRR